MRISQVSVIVHDYDEAIRFFVDALGFELIEDSPSTTDDGRPKRWVVVRPPGAETGLLLARADGERQSAVVGDHEPNTAELTTTTETPPQPLLPERPSVGRARRPPFRVHQRSYTTTTAHRTGLSTPPTSKHR